MWFYNCDINNSAADVELKYEDYKEMFSIIHTWDMKWSEFKAKIINIATYRINKTFLPSYDDKKTNNWRCM